VVIALSPGEGVLFVVMMSALLAAGGAVYAAGTHRLSVRPLVTLRVGRIATAVSMALLVGLIVWGIVELVRR
jgi:hypothetical protein